MRLLKIEDQSQKSSSKSKASKKETYKRRKVDNGCHTLITNQLSVVSFLTWGYESNGSSIFGLLLLGTILSLGYAGRRRLVGFALTRQNSDIWLEGCNPRSFWRLLVGGWVPVG